MRSGTVRTFDEAAGYGTLDPRTSGDGDGSWFFHCTSIADGSRTIAEGTAVCFRLAAGRCGRWEAVDVTADR